MCKKTGSCVRSCVLQLPSTKTLDYLRSSGNVELPVTSTLQVNSSALAFLNGVLNTIHHRAGFCRRCKHSCSNCANPYYQAIWNVPYTLSAASAPSLSSTCSRQCRTIRTEIDETLAMPIALMTMFAVPGPVVTIASAFAALLAWVLWHRVRQAIKYDLHKVPGPQQAPLLGNLASVIGSSYVHRVRRLTRLLAGNNLHRVCSRLRRMHAEEPTVFTALLDIDSDLLSDICRPAFENSRLHLRLYMQVLAQWTTQFGSVFRWSLAGKTILVITDPDEVHKLCGRDAHLTTRPRFIYKLTNPVSILFGILFIMHLSSGTKSKPK